MREIFNLSLNYLFSSSILNFVLTENPKLYLTNSSPTVKHHLITPSFLSTGVSTGVGIGH